MQETYGQNVKRLVNIAKTYSEKLEPYPGYVIEAAFLKHLDISKKFPTWNCIREIIEGKKPGKLCGVRYGGLLKKATTEGWDSQSNEELEFRKAYEAQQNEYAASERLPEAIEAERLGQIGTGGFKQIGSMQIALTTA